jgi:glycosyltransferase involved in cell wall biosynthesis
MGIALNDLSVVLPTRNERSNIGAFLASLHPAVELVVVDASDDGTDELIQQIRPDRTLVIRSDARIARARQIGAQAARGSWLLFTDADVRFEPGYFARLAHHGVAQAFYGPKHATPAYPRYSQFFNACQRTIHRLGIPAASGSNMGLHRNMFEQVGGFRLDLPVNEDTELMMRVRRYGAHVAYVRELSVRSLDDRRLNRGVLLKTLHSLSRNTLLFINLYIPLPRRWLCHDWGYWNMSHAHRTDL